MDIMRGKTVAVLFSVVFFLGIQACESGGGSSGPTTTTSFEGAIAGSLMMSMGKVVP